MYQICDTGEGGGGGKLTGEGMGFFSEKKRYLMTKSCNLGSSALIFSEQVFDNPGDH